MIPFLFVLGSLVPEWVPVDPDTLPFLGVREECKIVSAGVYREFGDGYETLVFRYEGAVPTTLDATTHFQFATTHREKGIEICRTRTAIESRDKFRTKDNSSTKARFAKERFSKWKSLAQPGVLLWLGAAPNIDYTLYSGDYVVLAVQEGETLFLSRIVRE